MHFLKSACLFPLLILILGGCKPQAALTPQAAFYDLKNAFYKSDAALLERQLSGRSIKKIRRMTLLFSRMEDRQLESLSKKFGLPPERLKNLSARDYCAITLSLDRNRNIIGTATRQKIVGVNREGNRATIRVENGMELVFVKEGPYWKFDMTGL
jgi:hypothetical protein